MNGTEFPPQTGKYAVKVKSGAAWRQFDLARLQISVGQPYHEGEKFRATVEWAKPRFRRGVIICVNDTLQRHNAISEGSTPSSALAFTVAAGDAWIKRNAPALSLLPDMSVSRWEDWRHDAEFPFELARKHRQYDEAPAFRKEVDAEVMAFWERRAKRVGPDDPMTFETFQRHSVAYLLEECAVFPLMAKRDRAVDIYPGSTLLPCKLQSDGRLGSRGYTRIDFRAQPASAVAG